MKEKLSKFSFIKMKNFCSAKAYKQMRRQDADWEEIFVKRISHKRLLPRIYQELLKLNNKKPDNQIKK